MERLWCMKKSWRILAKISAPKLEIKETAVKFPGKSRRSSSRPSVSLLSASLRWCETASNSRSSSSREEQSFVFSISSRRQTTAAGELYLSRSPRQVPLSISFVSRSFPSLYNPIHCYPRSISVFPAKDERLFVMLQRFQTPFPAPTTTVLYCLALFTADQVLSPPFLW